MRIEAKFGQELLKLRTFGPNIAPQYSGIFANLYHGVCELVTDHADSELAADVN